MYVYCLCVHSVESLEEVKAFVYITCTPTVCSVLYSVVLFFLYLHVHVLQYTFLYVLHV